MLGITHAVRIITHKSPFEFETNIYQHSKLIRATRQCPGCSHNAWYDAYNDVIDSTGYKNATAPHDNVGYILWGINNLIHYSDMKLNRH